MSKLTLYSRDIIRKVSTGYNTFTDIIRHVINHKEVIIYSFRLYVVFVISGCNGLHRTTAHNRFLVGSLGYNGLPTVMSGLDESLSDVTPRKKYPFELEKALHNVMFIQHHIQRQDEFNAVSTLRNSVTRKGKTVSQCRKSTVNQL